MVDRLTHPAWRRGGRPQAVVAERRGFTLTELMVVIAIISFLAVAAVGSMYGAAESAKRIRTQQTIGKIDAQLMPRWESYMTRRLPVNAMPTQTKQQFAFQKLWATRELLRMDFPDRYTDMTFTPVFLFTLGSSSGQAVPYYSDVSRQYQRMITQWTGKPITNSITALSQTHQSAECLYMIVTVTAQDSELAGNTFNPNEIGDTDNDGVSEFLDAWGNSIEFLRWAPGFTSDMQPVFSIAPSTGFYPKNLPPDPNTPGNLLSHFPVNYNPYQQLNAGGSSGSSGNLAALQYALVNYHDAFDPLETDPGLGNMPVPERGYNLIPLIVSAGPDGTANQMNYTSSTSGTPTTDTLGGFGLHWGLSTPTPTTISNPYNTSDDPFAVYSSPDGTGQTQRGAVDATTGPASYDNIHNQLLRTRP